jgi:SPP1 family predicted phage head-tail adaptor
MPSPSRAGQPWAAQPFEAGRLRDKITIRRLEDAPTGRGGFDRSWMTIADRISAEVIGQSGREAVLANTLQGVATYRITIRYRKGLNAEDQVIWHRGPADDVELNVLAPPNDPWGRRQFLQIMADTSARQNAD